MTVASTDSAFTSGYKAGQVITYPIAHHDGNYTIDSEGLARLKGEDRVALRYVSNPNGSVDDVTRSARPWNVLR